jgi:hypothetical protein
MAADSRDGANGQAPSGDERAFIETLVANGQAAELDSEGRLPAGATHEITGYHPDGLPMVVRRRFA